MTRGVWRRLPFETGPPEALLQRSVDLLDHLADDPTPVLRWYRSTEPALVLGRGQPSSLVRGASLPVVGRFSGGGAVLMDAGLLSLDLLVPAGHTLLAGGLGAVFLRVGRAWAAALRQLGVPDVTAHDGPAGGRVRGDDRERLLAAVCYATLGRGEVASGGRKLVGLAQRRRRPGALVQCGLLRRWDPGPLLEALGVGGDDWEILSAAVGLDELVDPAPDDDTVMTAVEEQLVIVEDLA